jgi:hypothetical protein
MTRSNLKIIPAHARVLLLILCLLVLPACQGVGLTGRALEQRQNLAKMTYPADAELGEDLNIVVVRKGDAVALTNLTAKSYPNTWLWLNKEFVGNVDALNVGTDNRYELHRFINSHGERYPRGALLAPDKGFPIVLAEMYDPETRQRHRLLARLGRK